MQCSWWVLPCPTLIPLPQVSQAFTALADQTVNHQAVCTPLAPEKTTAECHLWINSEHEKTNKQTNIFWTQI